MRRATRCARTSIASCAPGTGCGRADAADAPRAGHAARPPAARRGDGGGRPGARVPRDAVRPGAGTGRTRGARQQRRRACRRRRCRRCDRWERDHRCCDDRRLDRCRRAAHRHRQLAQRHRRGVASAACASAAPPSCCGCASVRKWISNCAAPAIGASRCASPSPRGGRSTTSCCAPARSSRAPADGRCRCALAMRVVRLPVATPAHRGLRSAAHHRPSDSGPRRPQRGVAHRGRHRHRSGVRARPTTRTRCAWSARAPRDRTRPDCWRWCVTAWAGTRAARQASRLAADVVTRRFLETRRPTTARRAAPRRTSRGACWPTHSGGPTGRSSMRRAMTPRCTAWAPPAPPSSCVDGLAWCAHVGDSRCYLVRDERDLRHDRGPQRRDGARARAARSPATKRASTRTAT